MNIAASAVVEYGARIYRPGPTAPSPWGTVVATSSDTHIRIHWDGARAPERHEYTVDELHAEGYTVHPPAARCSGCHTTVQPEDTDGDGYTLCCNEPATDTT